MKQRIKDLVNTPVCELDYDDVAEMQIEFQKLIIKYETSPLRALPIRIKCARQILGVGLKALMDIIPALTEKNGDNKLDSKIIDKLVIIEASFRAAIEDLEDF